MINLRKVRIGILGGTFDPVHNGHIQLAREAITAGDLDKVLFLVSRLPPHKNAYAADRERFEMVKLALEGADRLEACDIELRREGKSYTSDSVKFLRKEYPSSDMVYIIGSDVLSTLPYWHDGETIFSEVEFMCFHRRGQMFSCEHMLCGLTEGQKSRIHFFDASIPDISSQGIRASLQRGVPCPDLPDAVDRYIRQRKLYHQSGI